MEIKRCEAITVRRKKEQCEKNAMPNSPYCWKHTDPITREEIMFNTVKEISELVEQGLTFKDACAIVGVSERTLHYWYECTPIIRRICQKSRGKQRTKFHVELLKRAKKLLRDENVSEINGSELHLIRRILHKAGIHSIEWIAEKKLRKASHS